ncbi:hypothetical protein [Coleofasciculus sp. FACHB-129]|uniref:hypothetical protein n=1 Tax=Cyanophyceae TaxID=3028117 RepID=UPI001687FC9B|nr:hypothetical protein [Coleofasciculus sp. FACHB-129]MBD1895524.1 hypothetical protein [Coleofasciculus sp. FACHB-129]
MDEQLQRIPNNQFLDISPVSDIVHYAGLLHRVIDLSSEVIEYKKVVEEYHIVVEQEETKRLEIRTIATKEMTELSRQLDMLEKDLLADIDRLKVFVEGTMDAVQELIRKGQYEFADKFHERVSDRLEGRVSLVMNKFNQANSGSAVFKIEENE